MVKKKKATRTSYRTKKGKLMYSKRNAKGQFTDIQDAKKCKRQDLLKTHTAND